MLPHSQLTMMPIEVSISMARAMAPQRSDFVRRTDAPSTGRLLERHLDVSECPIVERLGQIDAGDFRRLQPRPWG